MTKNIHVHLHDPRQAALLQPRYGTISERAERTFDKACGCSTTRDADDEGEGRWVTIGGAHVHIGKGGKIDKGPKELLAKTELGGHAHVHEQKAGEHGAAAKDKGKDHPDTPHHVKAANMHGEARNYFNSSEQHAEQGNMKQARQHHEMAKAFAESAKEHEEKLSKKEAPEPAEKPAAHVGLHNDAGEDVKGSEKHEAEHKRLLKEYDKSKTAWERNVVNNHISKNAEDGAKANAQTAHHKALQASEHAKTTGALEHHQAARSAIDKARELNERAGGEGSKARIAELDKMRKPHHAAIQEHEKANPPTSSAHVSRHANLEDAINHSQRADAHSPTKVFHHPEGGYFVPPNAKMSGRYEKAGHKVAADYNGKPTVGKSLPMEPADAQRHASDASAKAHESGSLADHQHALKAAQHAMSRHNVAAMAAQEKGDTQAVKKHKAAYEQMGSLAKGHSLHIAMKPSTAARQLKLREMGSQRYGGKNPEHLAKIAARHLKKAAEAAADQDPKHQK